jgi:hypothetical protein
VGYNMWGWGVFLVPPLRAASGQIGFGFWVGVPRLRITDSEALQDSPRGAKVRWLGLSAWVALRQLLARFAAGIGRAAWG